VVQREDTQGRTGKFLGDPAQKILEDQQKLDSYADDVFIDTLKRQAANAAALRLKRTRMK
jgi:hypothetical protein